MPDNSRTQFLRITAVQSPLVWGEKLQNLDYFTQALDGLTEKTDLVVLPEMFATGFITDRTEIAEPMHGRVMQWMQHAAARLECVVTGSIAIHVEGNYFNRLIWMRPDGSFETTDKRHLFRMGNEHQQFSPGSSQLVVNLKGWKIRPLVCYDLRFPVWSKNSFEDGEYGFDLMIYVANWPASRSFVWKTLLAARAIENQAYCIGVNRIGEDGKGIPHNGHSMVLDFKGRPLLCAPINKPSVDTVSLDYQELQSFRERFTVGLDWDKFSINGL